MTINIPVSICKGCGKPNDAATETFGSGMTPYPDAISVCLYCGHLAAYADDLSLRDLNDEEIRYLAGHPKLLEIQRKRIEIMKDYDTKKS